MRRRWITALGLAGLLSVPACTSGAGQGSTPASSSSSLPAQTGSSSSAATATTAPTSSGTPSRASAAPASSASAMTVPLFWVGPQRSKQLYLYREFRTVTRSQAVVTAALRAMMTGHPSDRDLRTAWAAPSRLTVNLTAQGIHVDVSKDAFAGQLDTAYAKASLQQLVWTATAAAGRALPVTLTVAGSSTYRPWGIDISKPMSRDTAFRAPIWIDAPTQGQVVTAGSLTVRGSANVFEGTVALEIVDAATGKPAVTTFATAMMGDWKDFTKTVTLKAGRYTLHAYEPNQSETEGAGARLFEVTTDFTVR